MTTMHRMQAWAQTGALLVVRLGTGLLFFGSGYGKLHHLTDVAQYFSSLGVMAPTVMAPLVASLECAGGVMLALGLLTRLSACVLLALMAGAIASAHPEEMGHVTDLVGLQEFLLAQTMLVLVAFGAGSCSVDRFLRRMLWQTHA